MDGFSPYFPPFLSLYRRVGVHALVPSVTEWFYLDQASRPTKIMAPTYQTFADEESLISQPPKTTSTRKAAGVAGVAALVLSALGVSTVSHVNPMFDIVSAASGGIDFERIPFAENPVIPLAECPPPTAVTSAEFATNLTLPRKAPNLGPFKSIKVVDPSTIYLKDGSGATLVELDVELKVD